MIVMKGFLFLTDASLSEQRKKALSVKRSRNLPNVIPIIKITPEKEETGQPGGGGGGGGLGNGGSANGLHGLNGGGATCNGLTEEQSVYSTVSSTMDLYGTRQSNKSRQSSIFTLTINQEQLIQLRRASKEFLEKITPIDMDGWKQQNWGGRGFEIVKAPIRFFLLLTTPMADLEEKEEWNKPLSVLHCVTGPLFVLFASGSA